MPSAPCRSFPARAQQGVVAAAGRKRFVDWSFGHYLGIAPPWFCEAQVRIPDARGASVAA